MDHQLSKRSIKLCPGNIGRVMAIVALIVMICVSAGSARNYVSLNGGFYISYPDDWIQIDYNTVDVYLTINDAGNPIFDYEAVFAPGDSRPFISGRYLILTIDTVGELDNVEIDSVLAEMELTFGKGIKYYPVGDMQSDLKSRAPEYDSDLKIVSVVSDIVLRGEIQKKLLMMTKFYNKGIALFYFYSPDSLFERSRSRFEEIVLSFSTEDITSAFPAEKVSLADIDVAETSGNEKEGSSLLPFGVPFIALIVVLVIVVARRRRRRKA